MIKISRRSRDLLKDILIYGLGFAGVKIFNFLFLPIFTRYISAEQYGYFDLINTMIFLFIPLVSFQISDGVYRFLLDTNDEEEQRIYLTNAFQIVFKNLFIVVFAASAACFFGVNEKFLYFNYGCLWLIAAIINTLLLQMLRGLKRTVLYANVNILISLSNIILNIMFIVYLELSVKGLILANIITYFSTSILIIWKTGVYKCIKLKSNKEPRERILRYSVPLIANAVNWWIVSTSDRLIISVYLPESQLGIYAIANKVVTMLSTIYMIFHMGWETAALASYKEQDRENFYSKVFNFIAGVLLMIVIISFVAAKPFMKYYVAPEYFTAYKFIPVLLLGMVFNCFSSFYGTGYLSVNNTKGTSITSFIAAVINIGINLIFIPLYGINVAAVSTLISFFILWIIRVAAMRNYFSIRINPGNIVLMCISLYSIAFLYQG